MGINLLLRSAAFRIKLKSHHHLFSLLFAASILATPFIWAHTRYRSFAQTAAGAQAQAEKDVRRVEPGKPIERELAGGQSHSYKITLATGQYLDAVVEQRGIDVAVTLLGPDGKQILEVDSPNGDRGPEPVSWIVEIAGDYRLAVRSLKKDAASGRYEVKVVELRAATDRDRAMAEAHKLFNEAASLQGKGKYAEAISLAERALTIQETALGTEHPLVAKSLNNLGKLYDDKGNDAKAEALYQRALAILEKSLGPEHPNVAKSLNNLGTLYEVRGEMERAVAFHRRAAEVGELNLNRNLVSGSERQKLAYLDTISEQSRRIISMHIRSAPYDPAARDLAVTTILRLKGRALDAMTDSIAALRRRATPEDQALLDQLKEARSQLAQLALNGPQKITSAEHRARLKTFEEQTEKLEADISRRSAEFRALSKPITIAAVQAAIPAGSVLVEFFAYRPFNPKARVGEAKAPPRYVAYVLRRAGETRWVELGQAKVIDEAVNKLRQALRDPRRRDVKQLARKVDRLVMSPLRPLLTPSRRVFLSPDGALNLVPFAALVDKSGHYLVNHYEFSYLTSGRDLLRLQSSRPDRRRAMVVANPDFGESPSPGAEGGRGINLKYQPAQGSRSSILSNAFFPQLPGTADEANALKAMLPGAMFLIGAQATEAALKQAAGPEILHIATHGFFLPDVAAPNESRDLSLRADNPTAGHVENPLLRSGLALSGANLRKADAGQEDDGVLTAEEASSLDLRGTTLVILSACDTGVGEVRNGDGVYGLRRALALAGAETQVMSLWPVSDKATRDLMIEYYKKLLSGNGRSEALRATQLRMLARGGRASDRSSRILITEGGESARQTTTGQTKDYSHPYYWACFIQSGEWKKLDLRETPSH
jgi:CHAT domain-containing protein